MSEYQVGDEVLYVQVYPEVSVTINAGVVLACVSGKQGRYYLLDCGGGAQRYGHVRAVKEEHVCTDMRHAVESASAIVKSLITSIDETENTAPFRHQCPDEDLPDDELAVKMKPLAEGVLRSPAFDLLQMAINVFGYTPQERDDALDSMWILCQHCCDDENVCVSAEHLGRLISCARLFLHSAGALPAELDDPAEPEKEVVDE